MLGVRRPGGLQGGRRGARPRRDPPRGRHRAQARHGARAARRGRRRGCARRRASGRASPSSSPGRGPRPARRGRHEQLPRARSSPCSARTWSSSSRTGSRRGPTAGAPTSPISRTARPAASRASVRAWRGSGRPVVYVGDGYSDRCVAQAVGRVFARDGLARYLDERGVEYEPFEDLPRRRGRARARAAGRVTAAPSTTRAPRGGRRDHGGEEGFLVAYFSMEFGDRREPAGLLGRARRARRRPPQGGGRPRRPARRRRACSTGRATSGRRSTSTAARPSATRGTTRPLPVALERRRDGEPLTVARRPRRRAGARAPIWRADVGRVPLYLLDADVDGQPREDSRDHRARSTAATASYRLRQEIVLGIGGAARARGARARADRLPHERGPLGVPRARARCGRSSTAAAAPARGARAASARSTVFTTHTPVPAGNERLRPGARRALPRPIADAARARVGRSCSSSASRPRRRASSA